MQCRIPIEHASSETPVLSLSIGSLPPGRGSRRHYRRGGPCLVNGTSRTAMVLLLRQGACFETTFPGVRLVAYTAELCAPSLCPRPS